MSPFEIPAGIHLFTSDGRDAGVVSAVAGNHFTVRTPDGPTVTMPIGMAERVQSGRLLTWLSAEAFRIRFLYPVTRKVS